jgi:hypothetical protein
MTNGPNLEKLRRVEQSARAAVNALRKEVAKVLRAGRVIEYRSRAGSPPSRGIVTGWRINASGGLTVRVQNKLSGRLNEVALVNIIPRQEKKV